DITAFDPAFGKGGRTPKHELDPEAFMQLLVAQLRYQDPLQGTDTQQMMQQMATLNQVQQQTALNDKLNAMLDADAKLKAMSLLGHYVKGISADQPVEGKVTAVQVTDGKPVLKVGAQALGFDAVTEVS
ncbi:MAG: hypothetical protein HUU35_10275, partial [Armatimonadetes bacterium]|nr:hypothetical protein [Armatimonadota bacterium]